MDDKHSHIDEWLKRAAAQQPAPDDAGEELKRQAWSKMAALLDEEDAGKPQPRLFRFRLNWAAILIPFIAVGAVFAATLWVAPRFSGKTPAGGPSTAHKEHPQRKKEQVQQTPADTQLFNINNTTPQTMPADTINGFAGTAAEGGVADQPHSHSRSGLLPAGDEGSSTAAAVHTNGATGANTHHVTAGNSNSATRGGANANNKAEGAITGGRTTANTGINAAAVNNKKPTQPSLQPGLASGKTPAAVRPAGAGAKDNLRPPAPAASGTSTAANKKGLPHNKVNRTAIRGTVNDNEPVAKVKTGTDKRSQAGITATSAAEGRGPAAALYPVRTRNVFALQLPSLSEGSRDARVPSSHSAGSGLSMDGVSSRLALQLGLLSPLNSALGLRVGVLYIYPLGNNWFLQPQLSASYLTGYDKAFTHVAISKQSTDSSGGSGNQGYYNVDTTTTPYTFKRAFAGSAGINVGYHKNRLAVSTGLVYSMATPSGKKDSASVRHNVVRDSLGTQAPFTDPAFSTGRMPGSQQLSWNVDLSWYVLPRLQAGFNYRVVLWRSKGDKGFQAPLQRIQDNSLLELYIRIPIGRK